MQITNTKAQAGTGRTNTGGGGGIIRTKSTTSLAQRIPTQREFPSLHLQAVHSICYKDLEFFCMSRTLLLGDPNLWARERPCAARPATQAVTLILPQGRLQSDLSTRSSKVFVNVKLESKNSAQKKLDMKS